jgi:hypothetical protein
MSKFATKAEEVVEQGEERRGNFNPSGKPKEMYEFWLRRSKTIRAMKIRGGTQKENFCHYWRVVAIWAPLMMLGDFAERVFSNRAVQIALGIAALLAVIFICAVSSSALVGLLTIAGILIGFAWVLLSVFVGVGTAEDGFKEGWNQEKLLMVAGWVLFPVAGLVYGGHKAVDALKPFVRAHTKGFWLSVLGAVLAAGAVGFTFVSPLAVSIYLGSLAVVYGLYKGAQWLFPYLADKIDEADDRKEAKRQAYIEEHGSLPVREPNVFERFFKTAGEFIVFIAQVVRVNKWKICPLVDINANDRVA